MKKIVTLSVSCMALMAILAGCHKTTSNSYVCTCTVNQYLTTGNAVNNPVRVFTITDANASNAQNKCEMQMSAVLNNSGQSFTCTYK